MQQLNKQCTEGEAHRAGEQAPPEGVAPSVRLVYLPEKRRHDRLDGVGWNGVKPANDSGPAE